MPTGSARQLPQTVGGYVMPKKLEANLKRQARRRGLKGKRANAYVFGTLRKTGWKPKGKRRMGT
jgi:hypothetical protein